MTEEGSMTNGKKIKNKKKKSPQVPANVQMPQFLVSEEILG